MKALAQASTLVLLLVLAPLSTSPSHSDFVPARPSVNTSAAAVLRDLEYAKVNGKSLLLDLYLPEGAGPFPLIIWIHGGGWASGSKALNADSDKLRQVNRGFALASINYRLSWEALFPAQIADCKAAVRWLRSNAPAYNLDPNRIAVWGSSAGGHLAALVGTSGGVADLEGAEGTPEHSSRVQAVVDWFGPTDFLQMNAQALSCSAIDHDSAFSPESLLVGCAIRTCPDKARRANPIEYVTTDDPPFLIMHGTNDCLVPPRQSQDLHDALSRTAVASSLRFIQGAGHGGDAFETADNQRLVDEFFDANLKTAALAKITGAEVSGKKLFVLGENFENGAVVLLNGVEQKTANDDETPKTKLIAKKAGKKIEVGQTVRLQVKNRDGRISPEFSFTRP